MKMDVSPIKNEVEFSSDRHVSFGGVVNCWLRELQAINN